MIKGLMKIKKIRAFITGSIVGAVLAIIGFTITDWQFWTILIGICLLVEGNVIIEEQLSK